MAEPEGEVAAAAAARGHLHTTASRALRAVASHAIGFAAPRHGGRSPGGLAPTRKTGQSRYVSPGRVWPFVVMTA
jgi:hypothetical protein